MEVPEGPSMTPREILDQLEQAAHWPQLDDESVEMASVRLHAYGDGQRWALVMEVLGASTIPGPTAIHTTLYSFGNCLEPQMSYIFSADIGPALDNVTGELRPDGYILLRGKRTLVDVSPVTLERKSIQPRYDRPQEFELLLSLLPEERERLLATEEELRAVVPADLPQLLQLEEWNHPSRGERPGESETFRLLAEVLASGNQEHWRPVTTPNTAWENWL